MDRFDEAAAALTGDPMDKAAAAVVGNQRTQLRASLYGALDANPDQAARALQLGRQTGIPPDVVERNLATVQRNASLDKFDRYLETSPITADLLQNPTKAKVSHDDTENLSAFEAQFREGLRTGNAVQGKLGVPFVRSGTAQAVERTFLQGITEPVRRGFAQGRQGLTLLLDQLGVFGGLERQQAAAARAGGVNYTPGLDTARLLATQQRDVGRFPVPDEIQAGMSEISGAQSFSDAAGAALRNPRAVIETALQSLGQSTPALLGGAVGSTAGPWGTAAGAGMGSFAVEYSSTLQDVMQEKGANFSDALSIQAALTNPDIMAAAREKATKRGIPVAIFDALTARLAGRFLAGATPTVGSAVSAAGKEFGLQAGGGAAGEATAQAATGEYKPGDILMEALAELPSGLVEAPANFREAREHAIAAQQHAQFLENIDKLAAASKVRGRDAETFEQFIAQASEQGPVDAVYIDAKTLAQSGVSEEMAAASPSVAAQLPQALATGGDVRIPIAEYTTRIAGTDLSQPLLDHIRFVPTDMSRAESNAWFEGEDAKFLQQEMQRVIGEQQADDTFKASAQTVKDTIKSQLDEINRFNGSTNDAYATLIGNFFGVMAARLGTTPEALYQQFPLSVRANGMLGERALDQGVLRVPESSLAEFNQFKTGTPVTFQFVHNTESATKLFGKPKKGDRFQRDIEPSGRYVNAGKPWVDMPKSLISGDITFRNPLVLDERNWKQTLFDAYKKRGKNLSKAILADGYDGVVTVGKYGPGEILDLTTFDEAKALYQKLDLAQSDNPSYNQDHGQVQDQSADRAGQVNATTVAGEPAERGWADATRATGDDGKPARLFRGAGRFLSPADFEPNALGVASGNPSSGLGVWFSFDEKEATKYGDVEDFHLDLRNPFYIRVENLPGFDSVEEATAWREKLRAQGYDGIYIDGRPLGGALNVVAFEPHQAIYPQLESLDFTGRDLEQNKGGARAFFTPSENAITLLKNADLSSFLHEAGHFFLETTFNLASRPDAPAELKQDAETLLKWFGVRDLDEWHSLDFEEMRPKHEQFARGFEAYLFDGKAPSIELQNLFQRFRAWLLNIYRDLKNLNVELTPEVRGVMDRMLATTEEIKLAEQARSMMPLFATPEQAGMTPEEFKAYHDTATDATNNAIQDLQARGLRDMQYIQNARGREIKRLQKEAAAKREEVRLDMKREVMSEPVYQAWQFLTSKSEEEGASGKLSRAALDEMYGGTAEGKRDRYALLDWKRLTDQRMTAAEGGMHPDMVAEMFGFQSGDQLVRALLAAEKPDVAIDAATDAAMLERHGELSDQAAIERAADRAIHNDVRSRLVATEANALAKATGQRKILASAAKQFAEALISRLKIREVRPGQYAAAEARAAKNAAAAMKTSDLATAAAEKRNQLVQNYAARAAYDAQDEVASGLAYLKKFDSPGVRKNLDADYTDQIDALLERFDLRSGQSLKSVDKRTALAAWIEEQAKEGIEPDIAKELQNEAFRKSFKDMTVEEFRGLVDAVRQIEHLGRLKNKLLTAKEQREYEAARDEIVASINENANGRTAETRTRTDALGRYAASLKRFWASHIKAATWARVMDGGKDGGAMWEYFIRTANERGDMETQMRSDATRALSEVLSPVVKKWPTIQGKGMSQSPDGRKFPRAFTREGMMAVALNTGNAGNLQRLLGGEGWTVEQIRPVLESLTAEEWRAVQAVWDHFESYRPQIAAKERRIYGREPDWVEPTPFKIKSADGEEVALKGGYYPIKYDPAASQRAEEHADAEAAAAQLRGAYTAATTRRSFTKSRAEEVSGRPLLYSLIGVYSGVNDVIHDLAWHEWLIDANKLLRSQSIDAAIRTQYGPEVKDQFKQWVKDVAQGEHRADNPAEVGVAWLRQGVSAAGLGFNVMSAAMQVLGFNQSIVRVGPGYIARGIAQYVANPIAKSREVVGKSKFMADRSRTQFRELNELRNQVEGQTVAGRVLTQGTYFMMMRAQKMVDVPTWLGAYEKAIAEGNNEDRSVALADQAVIDSQGSGMVKDLSTVERGGAALKLFTVFYSFMNTALNVGVQVGMTERNKAKLAAKMLMLYTVPAVLGSALKDALTPGDSGDDDPEKLARKLVAEQLSYLTGLMVGVREFGDAAKIVAGAQGARDYAGPAGTRVVGDTLKFGKQAMQGDFDDAFRKASINLLGDLTGLPAAQINRSITGAEALAEGKTDNPAAVVLGYQKK